MSDLAFRIALSRVSGIGASKLRLLEEFFGDLEVAWRATPNELRDAGIDSKTVEALVTLRHDATPERELERLHRAGIQAFGWNDPSYPSRLSEIPSPPPVIFVKGSLTEADDFAIALVGTRKATAYGRQAAAFLAGDLVRAGLTIVSGLAKGIDSVSHLAALEAGGRTIAVLGSGLDVMYPPENARLAERIVNQGALISEYPLGTKPNAQHFPWRNRIIAGLSRGVVVVEADERSGAVITAGFALDQGREVFAVPGSIFAPISRGTNKLIKGGAAKLVSKADDILEELRLGSIGQQLELRQILPDDPIEAAVVKVLTREPMHVDDLCAASSLPIASVSAALAMLELKGDVNQVGPMQYVLAR